MRLIDANANRAREGLRVLEDYARFLLNSKELCESLKGLRHDLTDALRDTVAAAIFHRDTPHDVGTDVTTPAESKREDVADVVTAAGKRLGEALRAIEEYLKTFSPAAATKVESIRYHFYDVEQKLARTLPRRRQQLADVRLYVLITEAFCKTDWYTTAEAAIRGGADCLQLREKDLPAGELLRRARRLVDLCRRHGVLSIINDRPDVAVLAEADGVHVGQGDLPAIEARKIVGPERLVGVSTHAIEQARAAVVDGADYLGVGPVFPSSTKPRSFKAGLEYARQVAAEISVPAVAIAGITEENVAEVTKTGVMAVAVTAAVVGCADVEGAARRLKNRLQSPRPGTPGRGSG
jgi:thiamine-phosphate pyrophosphorylase